MVRFRAWCPWGPARPLAPGTPRPQWEEPEGWGDAQPPQAAHGGEGARVREGATAPSGATALGIVVPTIGGEFRAVGHLLGGWVNGLRGGPAWKRGAKKQPVQDAGLPRFPRSPVPFCGHAPAERSGNTSQAATGTSQPATGALLLTIYV